VSREDLTEPDCKVAGLPAPPPCPPRPRGTWSPIRPRPGGPSEADSPHPVGDLAEIARIYGTRNWIEQSYKQVKDDLGWVFATGRRLLGDHQRIGNRFARDPSPRGTACILLGQHQCSYSNMCFTDKMPVATWPAECRLHHPWRPGTVTITWEPCDCPAARNARGGHVKVRCNVPRCGETWWSPLHDQVRRLLGHRDDPYR